MPETFKRLTVEEVQALCKRHDAKLVNWDYGFDDGPTRSGCALSFFVLRHTDNPANVRLYSMWYKDVAKALRTSASYLDGLETGFDNSGESGLDNSPEYKMGIEDGTALRALVAD